jgi:hypothetical protein
MQLRLMDYRRRPAYPDWYDPTDQSESIEREALRRVSISPNSTSVDLERPKVWSEIDEIELNAFENRSLEPVAATLCREFDALGHIDRFARLVAVLNWYRETSHHDLPALPASDGFFYTSALPSFLMYRNVLPSAVPAVSWSALAVTAGTFWFVFQIILGIGTALWLIAIAARQIRRKLVPPR